MTGKYLPLSIKSQQFFCKFRNRFGSFSSSTLPISTTHLGQTRNSTFTANVLVEHPNLLNGNVKFIFSCVGKKQVVTMDTANFYIFYANITTNTVNLVNNVIPCFNITKVLELLTLVLTVQTLTLLHTENIIFS